MTALIWYDMMIMKYFSKSRSMNKNVAQSQQDFSEWSSLRLQRYSDDIEQSGDWRDRRFREQVSKILKQRENEYQEFNEMQESWIRAWKNVNTMDWKEKELLKRWVKVLKNMQSVHAYKSLPLAFKSLEKLLQIRPEEWKDKINQLVSEIDLYLEWIPHQDIGLVKIPEWWKDVRYSR